MLPADDSLRGIRWQLTYLSGSQDFVARVEAYRRHFQPDIAPFGEKLACSFPPVLVDSLTRKSFQAHSICLTVAADEGIVPAAAFMAKPTPAADASPFVVCVF